MAPARLTHSAIYLTGVIAIALAAIAVRPTTPHLPVGVVAGAVALLGVPHGAFDPLLAQHVGLLHAPLRFFGAYLALAGLVCVAWCLAPGTTLAGFLLASVWHFAGDWTGRLARWQAISAAGGIVALPVLFHPDAVGERFATLVPDQQAWRLLEAMQLPAAAATTCLVLACLGAVAARRSVDAAEIATLPLIAWLMEPLAFFVVYFCGLHSPRHLIEVATRLRPRTRTALAVVAGTTAVTLLGAMAAGLAMTRIELTERTLRVTFIGLAALTLPHMVLTAVFESRMATTRTQGS